MKALNWLRGGLFYFFLGAGLSFYLFLASRLVFMVFDALAYWLFGVRSE